MPQIVKTIWFFILFTCAINTSAQELNIVFKNEPLSKVLKNLQKQYGIQYSIIHSLAKQCTISISEQFSNSDEAVKAILKSCSFKYHLADDVYIIYPQKTEKSEKKENQLYFYSGKLVDAISLEPLPYSTLYASNGNFYADESGNFSFTSTVANETIKAAYIGYFIHDTLVTQGNNLCIELKPSVIGLNELTVNQKQEIFDKHIGEQAGLLKLNHKISQFLPGSNNNTIFNMLRLQPGIMASAEQSGDYMIWGGYKGQNLLQFDGITLFSSTSQNKEVNIINPLLIKDVEVFKGGYSVDKGERSGGLIQITGNSGNTQKLQTNISINNTVIAGLINVPINDKFVVQAGFRHSYFDAFPDINMGFKSQEREDAFEPDYFYRDITLKVNGKLSNKDNIQLSFLHNTDNSFSDFIDKTEPRIKLWENKIEREQSGFSTIYNRNWYNYGITKIEASYSSQTTEQYSGVLQRRVKPTMFNRKETFQNNGISAYKFKIDHAFSISQFHNLKLGAIYTANETYFEEDSTQIVEKPANQQVSRMSLYAIDYIQISKSFSVKPNIKVDWHADINYIQPRLSANYKPTEQWNMYYSWGLYKQYISQMPLSDELNNQFYFWGIAGVTYPIIKSEHNVAGISFNTDNFNFSLEAYSKTTEGLSKFTYSRRDRQLLLNVGDGRSKGIDLHVKQNYKNHNFWIAYSLSETEERFNTSKYQKAPQNQTHEIKAASIFNFSPWHASCNYVYGSGYNFTTQSNEKTTRGYERFDLSLLYKKNFKQFQMDIGTSVQNLFNNDNISFNGLTTLSSNKQIFARGLPFTTSIFVNLRF